MEQRSEEYFRDVAKGLKEKGIVLGPEIVLRCVDTGRATNMTPEEVIESVSILMEMPNNKMKLTLKGRGETAGRLTSAVAAPLQGSLF